MPNLAIAHTSIALSTVSELGFGAVISGTAMPVWMLYTGISIAFTVLLFLQACNRSVSLRSGLLLPVLHIPLSKTGDFENKINNKSPVVSFHPTTESNLRTGLGVEICKLCIIAHIWKPLSRKFSVLCREMGICLQI